MPTAQRLILASSSAGRRDLLTKARFRFDVQPSGVDEPPYVGFPNPRAFVQHLAYLKAQAVAARTTDAALILAADSVAWCGGEVLLKPEGRDDARRILTKLAGTTHELWTGVCLWRKADDLQFTWQEASTLTMRPWQPGELDAYLATNAWEGHSGGYAIEEEGPDPYLTVVNGTISNVVGLPVETLTHVLGWLAPELLPPAG
jgi:septum formation protein